MSARLRRSLEGWEDMGGAESRGSVVGCQVCESSLLAIRVSQAVRAGVSEEAKVFEGSARESEPNSRAESDARRSHQLRPGRRRHDPGQYAGSCAVQPWH